MSKRRELKYKDDPRFVGSGAQWAQSETGFYVCFTGRFTMEYREGDRVMEIPVESIGGAVAIELTAVRSWKPPYEEEAISEEKRAEIARNIGAAMRHLRTGFRIE